MLSPQPLRNGETPSRIPTPQFHSTVSVQKLKRFNSLILIFRLSTFCFSLASAVFTLTNSRGSDSPRWYDFDAFSNQTEFDFSSITITYNFNQIWLYRYVFAANAIVALYSLFEMVASVWEISRGATVFPEILQVWFDFGHDQVFAYLLLSADSAGTALARTLKGGDTCVASNAFCVQSYIAIALGFAAFLFLGLSSLLSGFRAVCFIINGSRFHI